MPRLIAPLLVPVAIALALVAPTHAVAAPAKPPTAGEIDAYLTSKGSPMTGQGAAFVASGGQWQVDPRLVVAIAGAESNFGQITCAPFNGWGWGCPNGPYEFQSWADGIDTVMKGLRTNYLAEGRTSVALIHQKYAPVGAENDPTGLNNNWTVNVSRFMIEMGGDPNDVDLDGIAGTMPLGPLGGASLDSFGFTEEAAADASADPDAPALEVAAGTPRPLVVRIRNTGYVAWRTTDVRLRRVDGEPRVVGAEFGALANAAAVEPNEVADFVVQLAAAGSSDGRATTVWRLEGPSGPFGAEIVREVGFSVPAFVATDPAVDVQPTNGGINPDADPAWNVIVKVRNAGSEDWVRDGDEGVLLGLADAVGRPHGAEGWINDRAATRMLERRAAPGEVATFAFRVRGEGTALALRPFRVDGWASGDVAYVELGNVPPALLDALHGRVEPANEAGTAPADA
ncbi:MAG: conjugal transfer protein [Thermoleophilia bacterium]|nr:conjugal transfer protein [Thermoleophilia bacterium]